MAVSSLRCHLADQHKIYQQVVRVEELIEAQADVTYRVDPRLGGKFLCPVLGSASKLGGGWMLWCHFQDLHPLNRMRISTKGYFPWCKHCSMKCRNTGLPAMAPQRRDAMACNPVFLHEG